MKKFFALLKVSIKAMLLTSSGVGRGKKKKAASGVGAILLIAFLGLYLSGVYSFMLMSVLAEVGMEVLVFTFMGIAALVGGLLFTTFAVKGVVFGGKDNDLLLSMPVSSTMLMASRVIAIYLENLVFSFFVLLPAGVACAVLTQHGVGRDPLFWLRLLLAALFLPLLDTALSVLLGALVAFLSAKVSKGKVLGQNIVMALYLAAVFYFCFNLNGMIEDLAANAAGIRESLTWAAPLVWMGEGILGDWGRLLAFMACCAVPFALVVFGLGKVYRKAVTAFAARSARNDYKLTAQTASGQKKALLMKEASRFFGTPMYFWNCGLGLVMLLAAGVAALVMMGDLRGTIAQFAQQGLELPVLPLAALVVFFCLGTCAISAPSFSLEGKAIWILREAPVTENTLVVIKTGFQLMLTLPCALIGVVCISIALALPPVEALALLGASVLFAVGHACFGTLMGLAFPKMDAANEAIVVKQSLAVVLTLFIPWGALAVMALLYWLGGIMSPALALALPLALLVILTAMCAGILYKRGPRLVRAL